MATPAAPPAKGKGTGLKKKLGPLPVWGWAAVAGGALGIWYYEKQKSAAAASSTASGATAGGAGQPAVDTGSGSGGGSSGGGGSGGGPGLGGGPNKWNQQPPVPPTTPVSSTATTTSNAPPAAVTTAAAAAPPSVTTGGTTANPNANVPTITNPNQASAAPEAAPTISGIGSQALELALANRGFDVYALSSNGQYVPVIQNGISVNPPSGTTIGSGRYYEPTQTGTKSLAHPLKKLP